MDEFGLEDSSSPNSTMPGTMNAGPQKTEERPDPPKTARQHETGR